MSYFESLFSLDNKISIVTVAARGNGKSIAEALLRSGSTVILIDVLKKELSKTVKKFQDEDLPAIEFYCDITKKKQISDQNSKQLFVLKMDIWSGQELKK